MTCCPNRSHAQMKSGLKTSKFPTGGGKMSGAHGTNTGDKSKGLRSSGGKRIGADCRTFNSGIRKPGGPRELG